MEITLIRHTTPDIKKGICYGQANIGVTSTFLEELAKIKMEMGDDGYSEATYFSSPLLRCSCLAKKLSDTVTFDDRLKELNFGNWELMPWDEIDKTALNIWMEDFVNVPAQNGESYIDLHKRTTDFIEDLKLQQINKSVIITHAGVIRSLWAYANKIPLQDSFQLKLDYGAIITLHF